MDESAMEGIRYAGEGLMIRVILDGHWAQVVAVKYFQVKSVLRLSIVIYWQTGEKGT